MAIKHDVTDFYNSDSGAVVLPFLTQNDNWRHQIAIHSAASAGSITITVKPFGLSVSKPIDGNTIALSDQKPVIFDGLIESITFTPDGSVPADTDYEVAYSGL